MTSSRWIELDGAANVRDLGGLPTADGRRIRARRLIRAASLQGLSAADVRLLVEDLDVRSVADLRTGVEVDSEGPGPLHHEQRVEVTHLSLFPEAGRNTDAAATDDDGPVVLPWQNRDQSMSDDERQRGTAGVYLRYLEDRADSILAAMRLIARTDGATIVHCAAGKDRTGVVVALTLAELGVLREAIVEDYALSAERLEAVFARLQATRTYASDIGDESIDRHRPRAVTMERLFDAIDEEYGGVAAWLRAHGWTEDDAAALRAQLLE